MPGEHMSRRSRPVASLPSGWLSGYRQAGRVSVLARRRGRSRGEGELCESAIWVAPVVNRTMNRPSGAREMISPRDPGRVLGRKNPPRASDATTRSPTSSGVGLVMLEVGRGHLVLICRVGV